MIVRAFALPATLAACLVLAHSASAQDATRGKTLYEACAGCHGPTGSAGEQAPPLSGVVGRKAGMGSDFRYSRAMLHSGFVWDEARLDAFLADPQALVPGNRMPFPGIADRKERADVIAYLKTLR